MLAIDPLRLALLLFLIARPRPVNSLLVYWLGAMAASVPYMLIPLLVLHVTPSFRSFAQHFASQAVFGSPTVQHIQFALGVVAILIAALMTIRLKARERAYVAAAAGGAPTLVADSDATPQDPPRLGPIKRLRARANGAWDSESPRAALVVGLLSGPPPVTVLLVLTTIMASDAAIGAQISLAVAWVFAMFAVVEIILISYWASPTRTETALRRLHNWVAAHYPQVWITMITVVGIVLLAYGMGIVTQSGR
jgi:hypothetical protein